MSEEEEALRRVKEEIDGAIQQIANQAPELAAHLTDNIRIQNGKLVYLDTKTKWGFGGVSHGRF